jgi:hypothetical protein
MEVLVAVVVAAALSVSFSMLAQQGARYLEDAESRLEHVDMAQSWLIERPFFVEHEPSPRWMRFADSMGVPGREARPEADYQWDLDFERSFPLDLNVLRTRNDIGTMSWTWIAP